MNLIGDTYTNPSDAKLDIFSFPNSPCSGSCNFVGHIWVVIFMDLPCVSF